MNIFACDQNPELAAQALDNGRLPKMILETAQILSTACSLLGMWNRTLYRPVNPSHPAMVWAAATENNFRWLYHYGESLDREFVLRFNAKNSHGSKIIMDCCLINFNFTKEKRPSEKKLMPFANITPYPNLPPILAYRKYLCEDKWGPLTSWGNSSKPTWHYAKPTGINTSING